MLSYTELKPGAVIVIDNQPYEVLEYSFSTMNRQKGVVQIKIRNLINGKILSRSAHANDAFEEADVSKNPVKYLYNHRDQYWFSDIDNPGNRFSLSEEIIGTAAQFLKPNTEVTAIKFNDEVVNIKLPVKADLIVKEAPPGEKGDTATGGKKTATLETGAKVQVPLFVNTGDTIRVNTETGEYDERVKKAA